ncbi:MAG: membrane protein insertion efficiency factor YidD [Bacteroidales bacterium]|nr:membrane protein insertion efficiency factor YidD [Bacteroidales bacterium]MBN2699671.1 membrane protein insertion efficiency factor YidD [Bacteroidales bacterium]
MKIKIATLSGLLFILPVRSQVNTVGSFTEFGDSLFLKGYYELAMHEYRRACFFAEEAFRVPLCKKIAGCYFLMEDFKMARNYCDSALLFPAHERIGSDPALLKILSFMMEENYGDALVDLNRLETGEEIFSKRETDLYRGICYFGLGQFDASHHYFLKFLPDTDTLKRNRLEQVFEKQSRLKRPGSNLATVLSILVPGAGQIYAGDYRNGLNSMLLLGGIVYLGTSGFLTTPVIIFPIFQRYYTGGILSAGNLARKKREQRQTAFYGQVKEVLADATIMPLFFEPGITVKRHPRVMTDTDSEMKLLLYLSYLGYKEFISSQDADVCVFYPSCSNYTMEAINRKGVIKGTLDGLDRLLRCHPFVGKKDYPFDPITNKYYDPL